MRESMIILVILVTTFIIAFIGMTALSDLMCQRNGYYIEGKQAEIGLYE